MNNTTLPPTFKKEIENLSLDINNKYCFDCNNQPALWASVNNGIFLCFDCSGDHKGFGAGNSFIRSLTLDNWNPLQLKLMKVGGNRNLRNFLNRYEIPSDLDKKTVYLSNIMQYYRKLLRAKADDKEFTDPLPKKSIMFKIDEKAHRNYNKIKKPIQREGKKEPEPNGYQNSNQMPSEEFTNLSYADSNSNSNSNSRFVSISSESFASNGASNGLLNNYYVAYASNMIGSLWSKSRYAAHYVRETIENYSLGRKIVFVGDKAIEILWHTGEIVIEKGTQIINSNTISSITTTAGNSIIYIKNKISSKPSQNEFTGDYMDLDYSIKESLLDDDSKNAFKNLIR